LWNLGRDDVLRGGARHGARDERDAARAHEGEAPKRGHGAPERKWDCLFMDISSGWTAACGGLLSGNTEIRPRMFRQDAPQVKASPRISRRRSGLDGFSGPSGLRRARGGLSNSASQENQRSGTPEWELANPALAHEIEDMPMT